MTTIQRCELTEIEVLSCAHCKGLGHEPIIPGRTLGPPFTAAYAGRCSECDERFAVGDRIRADGEGGYVGPCCGEGT